MKDVVDVYEINRDLKTRRLKLDQSKLLVIEMSWQDAKTFFSQRGVLATKQKFKRLQGLLSGHIPGTIQGIAFVGECMYALVDHQQENVAFLPEVFGQTTTDKPSMPVSGFSHHQRVEEKNHRVHVVLPAVIAEALA